MFFIQRTTDDPFDKRYDVMYKAGAYQHVHHRCRDKEYAKYLAHQLNKKVGR